LFKTQVKAQSAPLAFIISNNQPADKVYGQPNFTSNAAALTSTGADEPYHSAVDPTTGKVFVSDRSNHRILRYTDIDAYNNGEAAEAVLGQNNFISNTSSSTQSGFTNPNGLYVGPSGTLWMTSFVNNRVLRFDNASTIPTGSNADGVLGQTNFTNNGSATAANRMDGPLSVAEELDGTLWIADQNNQRILRFDTAALKPNGAPADGVLGKGNFTTNGTSTTQNRTSGISGVTVNAAGRLYASDLNNDRIIWWDDAKNKANGANADGQMGQPNFTTGTAGLSRSEMSNPRMVTVTPDNKFLAVADDDNNRTLIYINPNTSGEVDADFVFGQNNFTTGTANSGGLSASSINNPRGVFLYQTSAYENYLFVSDRGNNRTKLYVLFDIFYTTDAFTPIVDSLQATEVDGDVLTFTILDSTNRGGIVIDNSTTGKFTYTPVLHFIDYVDTLIYEVCDVDGCDTSIVVFNILTPKRLWVKADDGINGTSVKAWFNQIPSSDSIFAVTTQEPTLINNSLNFNPTVSFDGSNDFMYYTPGIINEISSVHVSTFIVTKAKTVKNQHLLEESIPTGTYGNINVWGNGNAYFEAGTALEHSVGWGGTVNTPYLWTFIQGPTVESISRNSLDVISAAGGSVRGAGDTTFLAKNTVGNFYDGEIAEIIHFQHSSGKTFYRHEENAVESYLGLKYGITLDQSTNNDQDATLGTDYRLSDSLSVAWNDADAGGYIHDIAGIGRDDYYGLNQKQSKSINADAIITMGLGGIYTDNISNTNLFTKDSIAMVWSNNDASYATWDNAAVKFGYNRLRRISREWRVEENLGDVGAVEISINTADLPASPFLGDHLFIVVDEDKNGDFTDGNLRLIAMDKQAGVWSATTNFNDDDIFTLMYVEFDFMRHGKFFLYKKDEEYQWLNR
jgi:sugar lactone lactonase YvrE